MTAPMSSGSGGSLAARRARTFRLLAIGSGLLALASAALKIALLVAGVDISLLLTSLMVVAFAGGSGALWRQATLVALIAEPALPPSGSEAT